jgi:ligand-binding sensor domain-containing protein
VAEVRYVYVFTSSAGARFDKLNDQWEFLPPARLPPAGFLFAARDHFFNDLYFVYDRRLIPYRPASEMQYPAIDLPSPALRLAFEPGGIWVQTGDGTYLCDRWSRICQKLPAPPAGLEWQGPADPLRLKRDARLYALADPVWQLWTGYHRLTAYAEEFASAQAWASYSGLGLWLYDLNTRERRQVTRGFLAGSGVSGMAVHRGILGVTGRGGITLIEKDSDTWQQIGRLFNLDLGAYRLNSLALNDRRLFIGTDRGVIMLKRGDDFAASLSGYDGLPDERVACLLLVGDSLWIGTGSGPALYPLRAGGRVRTWEGQLETEVNGMAADGRFVYLATSRGGLAVDRADSLKIFRYQEAPPELEGGLLEVAADGGYLWWLAPRALLRFERSAGRWERIEPAGNYLAGEHLSLAVDAENVWVGTDNGLARMSRADGRWQVYRREDGLLDDRVDRVLSAGGVLWTGGPSGLSRFDWKTAE